MPGSAASDGRPFDLFVPGRPSVDLILSGLPELPGLGKDVFATGLGVCAGTSFNTPAAANRLGLRVAYAAVIGDDLWSRIVLEQWQAEGLPRDFLRIVDRPIPFVSVGFNFDGDRGFLSYSGRTADDAEEQRQHGIEAIRTAGALHFHSYLGRDSIPLVSMAREHGMTVSLDAWGGAWWQADRPINYLASYADVLLANEPESIAMTGARDVHAALDHLGKLCRCAVIKRGGSGAIGIADGEVREVPGEPVEVVDTTGAGDCFNAGFLSGWLAGLPLEHSLLMGNICGAGAVGDVGGYRGCPTRSEIVDRLAARGIRLPSPYTTGADR